MKTIGIVGAGTMGTGIAYVGATSGLTVLLHDVSSDRLELALRQIHSLLSIAVQKNLLSSDAAAEALKHVRTHGTLADLAGSSVIIEAVVEDLQTKKDLFRQLDTLNAETTLLASNTSSFSITEIAAATARPERVAGMHFFNPPYRMQLVEIVRGHRTSQETITSLSALAKRLSKTHVVVKDTPGFIVNRLARPFYGESLRLLGEGVSTVEEIDRIVRLEGGFRIGPFELMDLIGIDVNYAVTQSVYEQFFFEPRFRPHPIQRRMVAAGLLGRKTGRGFYDYRRKP